MVSGEDHLEAGIVCKCNNSNRGRESEGLQKALASTL